MSNNNLEEKIIQLLTDLIETQKRQVEELANIRELAHRMYHLQWTHCSGNGNHNKIPLTNVDYDFSTFKEYVLVPLKKQP